MSIQRKIRIGRLVRVLLVFALLVVIVNPELRVLLLFVDSIGLELALLLLSLQLRSTSSLLIPVVQTLRAPSCGAASQVGSLALRAYERSLMLGRFDRLLCPILIIASYGLRCGVENRAA